jgi:hypothetical protein
MGFRVAGLLAGGGGEDGFLNRDSHLSAHALPATGKTRRASEEMWTTSPKRQTVLELGLG